MRTQTVQRRPRKRQTVAAVADDASAVLVVAAAAAAAAAAVVVAVASSRHSQIAAAPPAVARAIHSSAFDVRVRVAAVPDSARGDDCSSERADARATRRPHIWWWEGEKGRL